MQHLFKLRVVLKRITPFLPYLLCLAFFLAFSVLSIVRHQSYQSFGYDLGINDQTVWFYSNFHLPLTSIDPFPDKLKLYEHVELVYALISPIYWIWNSRRMLLITDALGLVLGGLAIYKLARHRGLRFSVSFALLFSYLAFFGVQNAAWFDVHSASFGATFIAWYIYFLDKKHKIGTWLFFILAITAKENIALITGAIAFVYLVKRRDMRTLLLVLLSAGYLFFIFFVYFPHIIQFPYLYQNSSGLLSNLNPLSFFDTTEKLQTIFYLGLSFGFLPLLAPLYLLPSVADLGTYFVFGSDLSGAQGIFMHYRVTLAPLLSLATIVVICKYKRLNSRYVALYLIAASLVVQYSLHLPLSYLSKDWFWQKPSGTESINHLIKNNLPKDASVVAQNNIVPHISHRDHIYSLYPEKKHFTAASPCGKPDCDWFRWYDHPQYLLVDTSPEWDIRHLLANRDDFIAGISNLEKAHIIEITKREGFTTLYQVLRNPEEYP